jgi:hypothetical protein
LGASVLIALAGLRTVLAFHDSTVDGASIAAAESIDHLVVSEVMTSGVSASDEFIEIYNPLPASLPLEGLEVVYVTASGGTITRKASWPAGSPPLPGGAHQLIANSAGVYAGNADATYTSGLAATGGSVAIRMVGAATAIDAVGWGNATGAWLEGAAMTVVAAGHSIERLPGGAAGSGQDTDDNSRDFFDQAAPDPQNGTSTPIALPTPTATASPSSTPTGVATASTLASPTPDATATPLLTPPSTPSSQPASATPTPTAAASATETPTASAVATATPPVTPVPTPTTPLAIAEARAMTDGAIVMVEGVALTDGAFVDGGGYVADGTAGIAVLVADGTYPRGSRMRISGELDDRFSQRTIRADASSIELLGSAAEPDAQVKATGTIGEDDEGELVAISGTLASGPTQLTTAVAYDVDDGSGPIRVLVGSASGIDLGPWARGRLVQVRGVIGQRDSSGSGTAGYRLQPRDPGDVLAIEAPTPTATPSASPSTSPSPSPSADPAAITIAAARAKPFNSRVSVRGVVTLPASLVEEGTAAIQDATGAIILRLGDEAGTLRLGELVEVAGTRSTKSGMETLRVVAAPRRLGTQALPEPRHRATGALGEADEAVVVSVRGPVSSTPRRTSADNVYFDVDDGSGPIRVFVAPGAGVDTEHLLSGTEVDVVGVLGQETTGSLPTRGYRLWPRRAADVRIVSQPAGTDGGAAGTGGTTDSDGASPTSGASAVGGSAGAAPGRAPQLAQQARPRLRLASVVTPSPDLAGAPPLEPAAARQEGDGQPTAAGLLLFGGLLLMGSAAAAGGPDLPARLVAWLRTRTGGLRDDEAAGNATDADDEMLPVGLPRLVPLPVVEAGEAVVPRSPRSIHEERERILPPT